MKLNPTRLVNKYFHENAMEPKLIAFGDTWDKYGEILETKVSSIIKYKFNNRPDEYYKKYNSQWLKVFVNRYNLTINDLKY